MRVSVGGRVRVVRVRVSGGGEVWRQEWWGYCAGVCECGQKTNTRAWACEDKGRMTIHSLQCWGPSFLKLFTRKQSYKQWRETFLSWHRAKNASTVFVLCNVMGANKAFSSSRFSSGFVVVEVVFFYFFFSFLLFVFCMCVVFTQHILIVCFSAVHCSIRWARHHSSRVLAVHVSVLGFQVQQRGVLGDVVMTVVFTVHASPTPSCYFCCSVEMSASL